MSQQLELVLASANLHKVVEIEEIFTSLMPECKLLARPGLNEVPDVDENADTLVGNAKLKALAIMNATQKPALADDTGLFVVALNGAPGVHSARFAGDEIRSDGSNRDAANRALLLQRLHGEPDRRAEFHSVMVVAWPNASGVTTWTIAEGVLAGAIATAEHGSNGFGYDQLFIPEDSTVTYAEMDTDAKNSISHRRRAVEALIRSISESHLND
jgi:XTP/dITP diphosphohydrolase